MQCSSCHTVYSGNLKICPHCQAPSIQTTGTQDADSNSVSSAPTEEAPHAFGEAEVTEPIATELNGDIQSPPTSTLIEFPGVVRAARPQWRKDLTERVREIQERRAREAARDRQEQAARRHHAEQTLDAAGRATQLGLVPSPEAPAINPIVAAALRRIERANQSSPTMARSRTMVTGGAATAVAHATETEPVHQPQPVTEVAPQTEITSAKPVEPPRNKTLVAVPSTSAATPAEVISSKAQPRRVFEGVVDDAMLARLDARMLPPTVQPEVHREERAPVSSRLISGVSDLCLIACAALPFAAIIDLTSGNWSDLHVSLSMLCILFIIMFLYIAASTALAGRTWGMSLFKLYIVDAETGLAPSIKQSIVRALAFIVSLASCGVGLLYALFDVEGRTAHDFFSRTIVVSD